MKIRMLLLFTLIHFSITAQWQGVASTSGLVDDYITYANLAVSNNNNLYLAYRNKFFSISVLKLVNNSWVKIGDELPKGIYMVKVTSNNKTVSKKLIIN